MSKQDYELTSQAVRCGHCGNKTLMKIISQGEYRKKYGDLCEEYLEWVNYIIKTLLCPVCDRFNVIEYYMSSEDQISGYYDIYLYPLPKQFADSSPEAKSIKETYREAVFCFKADLLAASVVMCRKTIELLCSYCVPIESYSLHQKIERMKNDEIIDKKLFDWATALRVFGNQAVHTDTKFSREDVQSILDFTYAFVEYCIDFDYKFNELMRRQGKIVPLPPTQEQVSHEQVEILIKALNDSETSIRYYAATALAYLDIEIEKVVPTLLELIEKGKFSQNAQNCLKKIGMKAVMEIINTLDTHSDNKVRGAAANILGDIGLEHPGVVSALFKALKSQKENEPQGDVQFKAALALEKLGYRAISTFAEMYNNSLSSTEATS